MSTIAQRKNEHLDAVLSGGDAHMRTSTGLEAVRFAHVACPELDLDAIDLSSTLLGKRLQAPFLMSSMTGGPARAATINAHLAQAAQELGIALAVGSQRVALEQGGAGGLDASLRARAPDVPLLANLGAAQIRGTQGPDRALRAVEMIQADALIIHLNPLQEAVQQGGDRDWSGVLAAVSALAGQLRVPIIAKEVGAGIGARTARQLRDAGVQIIDVAGAGGTSWAGVEAMRAGDPARARIASTFRDWGIPTARCIQDVRAATPALPIIASGGIRTGLDAARAIRLGANFVGQAASLLQAAIDSPDAVIAHFRCMAEELRIACLCTGSATLTDLSRAELLDALPNGGPVDVPGNGYRDRS